jgi:hypothetical protein
MTEYKYSRKEIAKMRTSKKLMTQCWLDTVLLATKPESPKESRCKCPYCEYESIEGDCICHYLGTKSGKWVKTSPLPDVEPLRLIETTTSRNELRQMEKEIMIENKLNELIDRLNTLSKTK